MNMAKCWTSRTDTYRAKCFGSSTNIPSDAYKLYQEHVSDMGQTNCIIYSYTRESPPLYKGCNKALKDDSNLDMWGGYVHFLQTAIKDRGSQIGWYRGVSWRGTSIPKQNMYLYQHKGRSFLWPSFLSSAKVRESALEFWNTVMFRINHSGRGTTYTVDVQDVSCKPWEKEVLTFPYTAFEIEDFEWSGAKLIVHVKTLETDVYEKSWMSRVDLMLNVHENKILNAQCFYKLNGTTMAALSWATRPAELSGSGSTISARNSLSQAVEFIETEWKKSPSRNCMHLNSGGGKWGILTNSKFGSAQSYKWAGSIDDIKPWVSGKWDEKYMITAWAGGEGKWFVIMTKGVEGIGCGFGHGKAQSWRTRSSWSDMKSEIDKLWSDGYVITTLAYEEQLKSWAGSFTESNRGQVLKWSKEFPTDWVKEKCGQNYAVTTLLVDPADDMFLVVMTTDRGTGINWSWNYVV